MAVYSTMLLYMPAARFGTRPPTWIRALTIRTRGTQATSGLRGMSTEKARRLRWTSSNRGQ